MRRYWHWIWRSTPTHVTEIRSGFNAALFGIWLLIPAWHTFATPSYAYLAQLATEETWGIVFAIAGVFQLVAVLADPVSAIHPYCPRIPLLIRAAAALVLGGLWVGLALSFASGAASSTAIPTYTISGIYGTWCSTRLVMQVLAIYLHQESP